MAAPQKRENISQAYKHSEPLAKRRRIALACSACRVRKSRCDGRRPSCSTCSTLSLECQYEPSDSSTNLLVRKEYVSDLEQRLKDVERTLQRHDDLLKGHLSACSNTTDVGFSTERPVQDGIQLDATNVEDPGTEEAQTDGLAIVFVDEHTPEFYGETSNIVFIRCLLRAITATSKLKQNEGALSGKEIGSDEFFPTPRSPSAIETPKPLSDISPSALPSGPEMDALLNAYFNTYASLFPFFHEPTFREIYEDCKTSDFAKVRRTWLGLLNMLFAMASNVDQSAEVSAEKRFQKSNIFFLRAVSLCGVAAMRTVSLDIVQYLLLAVLYLQGTQRSTQAWNVHGILVRTAIALGLHSDKSRQHLDPIQQEIRRRTWLTIYCLDKLLSVTFGRPPSIPEDHLVVKMPSQWPSIPDSATGQPEGVDIYTEFLVATVKLYRIVGRSVTEQYGMNLGPPHQNEDENTVLQTANVMRQELRRWAIGLPPHLSLCEPGSAVAMKNTDSNRLRVIMTLRHHFASILVHRPLLCATLRYLTTRETPVGSALPYKIQLSVADAHECIQSAENTIDLVHTILKAQKTGSTNLGVWFFTLFYVFTSSLVVLGRSVMAQHGIYTEDESPDRSVHSFLTKALESLDRLDKGNRLVYNCAKFIQHLSERHSGQGESASRFSGLIARMADATKPSFAAADSQQAGHRPDGIALSKGSAAQQNSSFFAQDLEMAQFSGYELFNPYFEDSVINAELPQFWP